MTTSQPDTTTERVEQESSPSTGARGTAVAMHAVYGLSNYRAVKVTDGDEVRKQDVLLTEYEKEYFGVSS